METVSLPPIAGSFIQSLRSVGYSLESAIADLVDNSISAHAKSINIFTEWRNGNPILAVMDDGIGMLPETIQKAMQLGAINPNQIRDKSDLGRFGMGLKTASFSQCKKLILISRTNVNDDWYGICWDLDLVEKTNQWLAQIIPYDVCETHLNDISFPSLTGTAVIWSSFDRAIDPTSIKNDRDYERRIVNLIDHLSLIFHRFINNDNVLQKVSILLNKKVIKGMDPFAINPEPEQLASTLLSEQALNIGKCTIQVKAYILPHPSMMSYTFSNRVSNKGEHHLGQGIYIYRAGRLIVAGGWQKLAKASEANKLARISIEFNNDADHLWCLDVKKSRVELPALLREQLKRIIFQCSVKSSNTFTRRAKMQSLDMEPIWQRVFDRDKQYIVYKINRTHSLLAEMINCIESSEIKSALLTLIEQALPLELLKNDVAALNIKLVQETEDSNQMIKKLIQELLIAGFSADSISNVLLRDSNFSLTLEEIDRFIKSVEG